MFAKNEIPGSASALACRQELEYLYARLSAIDSLIESLEEYDRVREDRAEDGERRGRTQRAPRTAPGGAPFAPRSC